MDVPDHALLKLHQVKLTRPFTGILAFVTVLLTMPLGHVVMIVMENILGHEHVFMAAIIMGMFGVVCLFYGSSF